jgi:hypothetical protein
MSSDSGCPYALSPRTTALRGTDAGWLILDNGAISSGPFRQTSHEERACEVPPRRRRHETLVPAQRPIFQIRSTRRAPRAADHQHPREVVPCATWTHLHYIANEWISVVSQSLPVGRRRKTPPTRRHSRAKRVRHEHHLGLLANWAIDSRTLTQVACRS